MKILIVEDDPLVMETLKEILSEDNYEIETAADGNLALETLEENSSYSLMITDVIMPEKEGIELISQVKKNYPKIKILAISGGGRTHNYDFLELAGKIGADKTLTKPFKNEELLAVVKQLTA